jgi:hypothetical protein
MQGSALVKNHGECSRLFCGFAVLYLSCASHDHTLDASPLVMPHWHISDHQDTIWPTPSGLVVLCNLKTNSSCNISCTQLSCSNEVAASALEACAGEARGESEFLCTASHYSGIECTRRSGTYEGQYRSRDELVAVCGEKSKQNITSTRNISTYPSSFALAL